jgi:hypothetical protein
MAWRTFQLMRNACRHGARGNAPRLGMTDQAVHAALQLKTDLRQLRGFARAGFTADDDHLIVTNRLRNDLALADHRQIFRIGRLRQIAQPVFDVFWGAGFQVNQCQQKRPAFTGLCRTAIPVKVSLSGSACRGR